MLEPNKEKVSYISVQEQQELDKLVKKTWACPIYQNQVKRLVKVRLYEELEKPGLAKMRLGK